MRTKVVLPLIVATVFILLLIYFSVNSWGHRINRALPNNIVTQPTNSDGTKLVTCTRTSRLDNDPQYDRALSFIQQRINENLKRYQQSTMHLFKYFSPELVNCIKIKEVQTDNPDDFEGYFVFNGEDIKDDYYPIVVNSKYLKSDDTLIALLLSHEMTHVQQYIDAKNNKANLSCIDKEVEAFLAQHRFFVSVLNSEENNLMLSRIHDAVENSKSPLILQSDRPIDGQLLMLQAIMDLRSNTVCEMSYSEVNEQSMKLPDQKYYDCVDSNVPTELKKIIENDSYYKKQCEL